MTSLDVPDQVPAPSRAPNRKVAIGGLAGALTVVLAWALREFAGVEMPAEVSSSVTVIVTFATSYMVRNPA